jgi:hypothetical protein
MSEFSDKSDRSYEFKPRPGGRPEGGHKIVCEICGEIFKTKEEDSLYYCQYSARAWGWKGSKTDKKKWRCPEHIKTPLGTEHSIETAGDLTKDIPLVLGFKKNLSEAIEKHSGKPVHRPSVGGIVRLRTRYSEGLKR